MIFLILVTCKNKATPASFLRQTIHSPSRFSLLCLSSLEQELAKLGEHVTLWFALTPPSLKWLTEQKNPKSLLRSILEFSIFPFVCCLSPVNFVGHFRISSLSKRDKLRSHWHDNDRENSHPHSNKTHYCKKGFALSIVSKVRAELGIGLFHGVTVMIFANKEVTNACTFAVNNLKGRRN